MPGILRKGSRRHEKKCIVTLSLSRNKISGNLLNRLHSLQTPFFDPNPLSSDILDNKTTIAQKLRIPAAPETYLFSQRNHFGTGNANRHIKADPVHRDIVQVDLEFPSCLSYQQHFSSLLRSVTETTIQPARTFITTFIATNTDLTQIMSYCICSFTPTSWTPKKNTIFQYLVIPCYSHLFPPLWPSINNMRYNSGHECARLPNNHLLLSLTTKKQVKIKFFLIKRHLFPIGTSSCSPT